MSDTYKGLTVKIGADTSSLSSALRKARSEVSGISSELRKVQKALKLDPGNTRLLAQQQEDYKRQISATTKELDLLMQAEKKLQHEMSADFIGPVNAEAQQEQWRKLQSDIAMTEIKLKGYKQALADSVIQQGVAESALGKLGSKFETMGDRLNSAGRKMETMGSTLTRTVSTGIVAAGAASVAAAVNIDTSMTNVKKTVDGTADQYDKLKEKAIEFSKTNAVGADQILDIQALGAQLGFSIEELDEFGRIVSGLDIATNMDADTAATEMAQFANITKMSHDEISNYGSAIVGLGNNFATTESDISSMAMRIAAAGTQVGMSQADILGLATALSSMGVEAEAGGTAISTIMAQIDKDIATNADSVETWASTAGMSAQDFADAWRSDPVDALSALLTNMESATEEGGNMSVMLQELGIDSIRQTDIMKRLGGNSELVADAVAKSNEEWGKNTALQKEVDNRNESLAAKFEMLKNRVVAVANDVGGPLADALLDVIDSAEPLIQMIADGAKQFNEMSKSEQNAVIKAVALSAAIGPMLNIFGKGVQQISGFGKGLQKLAQFFATVDYKTSGASRGLKDFDGAAKASESSTKKQATAVKASSVAMGAAKTAAIGLAIAGILVLVDALRQSIQKAQEAERRSRDLEATMRGLEDAAAGATVRFEDEADAVSAANDAFAQSDLDQIIQDHKDLATSITEVNQSAATSVGLLSGYGDTVQDLAGKTDLTEEQVAELKLAVEGANDALGTSWTVAQDAEGAWQVMGDGAVIAADKVRELIDAQSAQLRLEAVKENYKSTYAQLAVDAENYAAATDDVSRKQHALNEKLEELGDSRYFVEPVSGAMIDLAEAEQKAYDEAVSGLEEIEGQYGSTQSAANRLEEQMKLNAMAAAEGASEFIKAADSNMQYKSAVQQCGVDLVSFTQHLEKMGFTTEQLASMQPQQVQALAKSWEGGTDKMIAACEEAGIEIPQALRDAAQGAKTSIEAETPNVVQSAYIMKDGVLQAYNPITGEFSDATLSAMAAVNSGIFGNTPLVIQSVADLEEGMVNVYNPVTGEMEQITLSAVQTAEGAIRNGEPGFTEAVNTMRANGTGTLQLIEGEWQLVGENATSNLGGGMNENMDVVEGAVDDAVSTVDGIKDAGSDSYTWGLHVIGNFARGISSGVGGVLSDAVNSAANMVADKIKFSEPKKGPLRRLDISGRHMVQNFTRGIERQMPEFQRTIDDIADVAAGGFNMRSSVSLSSHRMAKQPSGNGISVTVDQRGGMTESQVYSAVRSAMSDAISRQDGRPIVIQLNEREIARVVRNII